MNGSNIKHNKGSPRCMFKNYFSKKVHVILYSLIAAKWLITGWSTKTIYSLGALFRSVSNLAGVGFEIEG